MKILYYSDTYSFNVMGTKRSIFEEIQDRGIDIIWKNGSLLNKILQHVDQENPTQVWLASSTLILSNELKDSIGIPVITFGFSDPNMFKSCRLDTCTIYVTNNRDIFEQYKNSLPVIYNPTACDLKFHKQLQVNKKYDITFIGSSTPNRVKMISKLRKDGFDISVFGNGWPKHFENHSHIAGEYFLRTINQSKIGLDIENITSPLAHRMFEYAACGVPVITRSRPEVFSVFEVGKEILVYENYEDLKVGLNLLLKIYKVVGSKALERCRDDHTITNRIDHLLNQLEELL